MPPQDLIHYFQQQHQGCQGGRITPNGHMRQNTLFGTFMPHLPAYICVFGIASGVYLLRYHGDSGDTNILLTIPREQSQRQWWDILTYFLRYHGNSHRDSGEMNETISTWYTTSYDTTGTVVKRTKHSDLGQQGIRWWRQYLRTTEKGLCQHLLERPHLSSGRRKLARNRKLDSLSGISWTEPNSNENELKSNGSYEGMQAELEWKQARIKPIPTNMLHTFRDFHLIPTLHHHVRLEWD